MGEDGGLQDLASQTGDLLVVLRQEFVDIGPFVTHGVAHHHQVGALAGQAPGRLGAAHPGGGGHHGLAPALGHRLLQQVLTDRGVLGSHFVEI